MNLISIKKKHKFDNYNNTFTEGKSMSGKETRYKDIIKFEGNFIIDYASGYSRGNQRDAIEKAIDDMSQRTYENGEKISINIEVNKVVLDAYESNEEHAIRMNLFNDSFISLNEGRLEEACNERELWIRAKAKVQEDKDLEFRVYPLQEVIDEISEDIERIEKNIGLAKAKKKEFEKLQIDGATL